MINKYKKFLDARKAILIAPAGHGKTFAIAQCIKLCNDAECQLVLTHTHAGVASITKKLQAERINKNKYLVETIDSFIRKYVCSYTNLSDKNVDPHDFFDILLDNAEAVLNNSFILDIVAKSYHGIFVDEYQDCSLAQHKIIESISTRLPVHLFGDPLQGIFDFNRKPVNFKTDLKEYEEFNFLEKPWRWNNKENCKELGETIISYRKILESDDTVIYLETDENANLFIDKSDNFNDYHNKLNDDNVLIIYPSYKENDFFKGGIKERAWFRIQKNLYKYNLLESFDDKAFYSISKLLDDILDRGKFLDEDFKKLYQSGLVCKNIVNDDEFKEFYEKISYDEITRADLLMFFNYINSKKIILRPNLFNGLYSILQCDNNESLYNEMIKFKNIERRVGRNTGRKCIGTTLLTKGLEFDTVIVYNVDKFTCPKNFYVAVSRACKKLMLFYKDFPMVAFDS